MIQYKRQVPIKAQDGITLRSDNTFVSRPQIRGRIPAAPGYGTEWTYVDVSNLPSTRQESNVAVGAIRLTRPILRPIIQSIATYSPVVGSFLGERSFQAPSDWSLVPGTSTIYKVPIREGMYIPGSVNGSASRGRDLAETANATDTQTETQETPQDITSSSSETTPPNNENDQKKSWRDKLADKVADKIRGKKSTNQSSDNQPKEPKRKINPIAKKIGLGVLGAGAADVGRVVTTNNLDPNADAQLFLPWLASKIVYGLKPSEARKIEDITKLIDKIHKNRQIEYKQHQLDSISQDYIGRKPSSKSMDPLDSLDVVLNKELSYLDSLKNARNQNRR